MTNTTNPTDDQATPFTPQYLTQQLGADYIVVYIAGPTALAAAEKIAAVVTEALNRPARSGNWNGNKKQGTERGLFAIPPDLATFEVGDLFKVPVSGYQSTSGGERLNFFSPFAADGSTDKVGVLAVSIKKGTKTWDKFFEWEGWKQWKPDTSGTPKKLPLMLATYAVGNGDKGKYSYLVSMKKSEQPDPLALDYAELPAKPEQEPKP